MTSLPACPSCGASWMGAPIPPEQQEMFGGTHFKRETVRMDRELDRWTHAVCPDCGASFERAEIEQMENTCASPRS